MMKPDTNTLTGWCDLNGGQFVLMFTDPLGQSFFIDVHFDTMAGEMWMTGHWVNAYTGQRGKFIAVGGLRKAPVPNESCLDKTARTFTLIGAMRLLPNPTL